jgi:hypothetical protein
VSDPTYAPFPVDVTAYDTDNTSRFTSADVVVINTKTGASVSGSKTNSLGQSIVDLANLAGGYSAGDWIHIIVFKAGSSGCDRFQVVLADGGKSSTVYTDDVPAMLSASKIHTVNILSGSTAGIVKVYSNYYSKLVAMVESAASQSSFVYFGEIGIPCRGAVFIKTQPTTTNVSIRYA